MCVADSVPPRSDPPMGSANRKPGDINRKMAPVWAPSRPASGSTCDARVGSRERRATDGTPYRAAKANAASSPVAGSHRPQTRSAAANVHTMMTLNRPTRSQSQASTMRPTILKKPRLATTVHTDSKSPHRLRTRWRSGQPGDTWSVLAASRCPARRERGSRRADKDQGEGTPRQAKTPGRRGLCTGLRSRTGSTEKACAAASSGP